MRVWGDGLRVPTGLEGSHSISPSLSDGRHRIWPPGGFERRLRGAKLLPQTLGAAGFDPGTAPPANPKRELSIPRALPHHHGAAHDTRPGLPAEPHRARDAVSFPASHLPRRKRRVLRGTELLQPHPAEPGAGCRGARQGQVQDLGPTPDGREGAGGSPSARKRRRWSKACGPSPPAPRCPGTGSLEHPPLGSQQLSGTDPVVQSRDLHPEKGRPGTEGTCPEELALGQHPEASPPDTAPAPPALRGPRGHPPRLSLPTHEHAVAPFPNPWLPLQAGPALLSLPTISTGAGAELWGRLPLWGALTPLHGAGGGHTPRGPPRKTIGRQRIYGSIPLRASGFLPAPSFPPTLGTYQQK